jgi:putative phosphoribosyl transferase
MNGSNTEHFLKSSEPFVPRKKDFGGQPANHWVAPEWMTGSVSIPVQSDALIGKLCAPSNSGALVLLSHTNALSSCDSRNESLAQRLAARGFAVLEVNLLTPNERDLTSGAFDLGLLALRIVTTIQWVSRQPQLRDFKLGCLGLGAGGTAALIAAGALSRSIGALVVADAQPDLVGDRLMNIHAPTLLISSATHDLHQRMNEIGFARLLCKKELELLLRNAAVEPTAALDRIASLSADWFARYLDLARNSKARRTHDILAVSRK